MAICFSYYCFDLNKSQLKNIFSNDTDNRFRNVYVVTFLDTYLYITPFKICFNWELSEFQLSEMGTLAKILSFEYLAKCFYTNTRLNVSLPINTT